MGLKRTVFQAAVLFAALTTLCSGPAPAAAASISGRVTIPGGSGIADVWVDVYDTAYALVASGLTDNKGDYTVFGLPAGDYKVQFWGSDQGYLNEWYDNQQDFNSAVVITVSSFSSVITYIDAELSQGGSISGRVTDSGGAGIFEVWVDLYDTNWEWVAGGSTDAKGDYTIDALPEGSYKVEFLASNLGYFNEWYDNQPDFASAVVIPVSSASNIIVDIDAVLERGGSISGRVTDSLGAPIPDLWVDLYDTGYDWVASATTDLNGDYTVMTLPTGDYKVEFWGSGTGYISEWYDNRPDFDSADIVSVAAPSVITGVDAALAQGGGITGRVTSPGGTGIANAWVGVYDTTEELVSSGWTDETGAYSAMGLPTGSYRVEFKGAERGYIDEWYSNRTDFASADAVAVTAPSVRSGIDAELAPGGSISGKVTDPGGAGIPDVWVDVYDMSQEWISYDVTDSGGNYRAGGLGTGSYKVVFDGSDMGYPIEWYDNLPDFTSAVAVAVTAPSDRSGIDAVLSLGSWRDGAADLGGGWHWLDWFGYFNMNLAPWVYHQEHGFLYPFGDSADSIVFWDNAMSAFWWTSETQYPYVYRFSDGEWLWYQKDTTDPRWFVRLSDGGWESW